MMLNRTSRVVVVRQRCPPEDWEWLRKILEIPDDDRPYIELIANSDLHLKFAHRLNQPLNPS